MKMASSTNDRDQYSKKKNPEIGISLKYTYTAVRSRDGRIQEIHGLHELSQTTNCTSKNKVLNTGQPGLYNSSHSENLSSKYNSPIQNNYI